jgi:hypothetical protein
MRDQEDAAPEKAGIEDLEEVASEPERHDRIRHEVPDSRRRYPTDPLQPDHSRRGCRGDQMLFVYRMIGASDEGVRAGPGTA